MNRDIHHLRQNYIKGQLSETKIDPNPLIQFNSWFNEAINSEIYEPNAMIISTVDEQNCPEARVVLLKEITHEGLIFYTNYHSAKGKQLEKNPYCSLVFYWDKLERQVRIKGKVSKISESHSLQYFQSRPKESQIGAHASPQSQVIPDSVFLEKNYQQIASQFKDEESLPLPKNWGGYLVSPTSVEFWQGKPSRLHDRLRYSKKESDWIVERLAP